MKIHTIHINSTRVCASWRIALDRLEHTKTIKRHMTEDQYIEVRINRKNLRKLVKYLRVEPLNPYRVILIRLEEALGLDYGYNNNLIDYKSTKRRESQMLKILKRYCQD